MKVRKISPIYFNQQVIYREKEGWTDTRIFPLQSASSLSEVREIVTF